MELSELFSKSLDDSSSIDLCQMSEVKMNYLRLSLIRRTDVDFIEEISDFKGFNFILKQAIHFFHIDDFVSSNLAFNE